MDYEKYKKAVASAKRAAIPDRPPMQRSCAGCFNLTSEGYCTAVLDYPPIHFLNMINECPKYEEGVPF